MSTDHYALLGVSSDADPEVIEAAYRALMKKHHPDNSPDRGAAGKAQEINMAYAVLRDPEKRRRYDRERTAQLPSTVTPKTVASSASGVSSSKPKSAPPDEQLRRCPECAEQIQKAAKVCRYCGHQIAGSRPLPAEANAHTTAHAPRSFLKSLFRTVAFLIVAFLALFFLLVAGGFLSVGEQPGAYDAPPMVTAAPTTQPAKQTATAPSDNWLVGRWTEESVTAGCIEGPWIEYQPGGILATYENGGTWALNGNVLSETVEDVDGRIVTGTSNIASWSQESFTVTGPDGSYTMVRCDMSSFQ